jgi:hypothetical protein
MCITDYAASCRLSRGPKRDITRTDRNVHKVNGSDGSKAPSILSHLPGGLFRNMSYLIGEKYP